MRNHVFVRSADPNFGSVSGGACAEQVYTATHGWVFCGYPESAHPTTPRPERAERPDSPAEEPPC